ncbi:MAG: right-handed parallel beta-helix repeat-containing protein [Candidatus Eisenbacteria bacterium]|uniref:Right-handed parallel beta-helix repeat-containing protein n=1 Tax=Eiseniibacteriota bacterium TaxID=2212470 RepID=A0A538TNV7_UNCEI|nr:MAG: right-handed parallel beta-helix repeat-containing protein [Candidatus Eisenbacteria bacterium]
MLTFFCRTPLRWGRGWVLALSFGVVACGERPEATAPSPPLADLLLDPPACGTVTTNTNLSGDCMGPLVVGGSGITVNLGGHAVTCGTVPNPPSPFNGIEITAQTDVHVTNGEVKNCGTGIAITGGGGHQLSNLNVHNHGFGGGNFGDGIRLTASSNNDIRNTTSSFNHALGVRLLGNSDFNKMASLELEQNDGPQISGGILLAFGADNNTVSSSFLLGNGNFGIGIAGSNNTIDLSTEVRQSNKGATPIAGTFGGSPMPGIEVFSSTSTGTTIRATTLVQNLVGVFLGSATNTTIQSSEASNNVLQGIRLTFGARSNLVQSNKAFGNGTFDLEDDNPACDANTWKSNKFGTANQSCIN